jgi:RsiW-degrading membrane proteinase PrsW (M82 family)
MDVLIDYLGQLNWLAVVAAAVAAFASGALWYSKALFLEPWMKGAKLSKKDVENPDMLKTMGGGFVSVLVSAVAMAVVYDVLALDGVVDGMLLGVLIALGFVVSNKLMHTLFEMKPNNYILITSAGDVVALGIMGAVLGLLR